MNQPIMTVLRESVERHEHPLDMDQLRPLLKIFSTQSETEFLHGFEACQALLRQRAGSEQCRRAETLLPLWIELGRPHPSTMRLFLLGMKSGQSLSLEPDRCRLTDLVNWSYESYQLILPMRPSSIPNTEVSPRLPALSECP